MFELFLGGRFFSKRVINYLAVFVVAFSIVAPVVVLAVMQGFSDYMKDQIRGALADTIVGWMSVDAAITDPVNTTETVASLKPVAGAAPFIRSFVIVKKSGFSGAVSEPALLQGIDPLLEYRMYKSRGDRSDLATAIFGVSYPSENTKRISAFISDHRISRLQIDLLDDQCSREQISPENAMQQLTQFIDETRGADIAAEFRSLVEKHNITWDAFSSFVQDSGYRFVDRIEFRPELVFREFGENEGFEDIIYPEAFVNVELARHLGLRDNETFTVASVTSSGEPVKRKFRMTGVLRPYSAAKGDRFDMPKIVVSFSEAALLFGTGGKATGIAVWLKPGEDLAKSSSLIREHTEYPVYTWMDLRMNYIRAMEIENRLLMVVMMCIAVAAGFAILAIIYTSVSEKVRDIGILKAVGITPGRIVTVFMFKTLCIGAIGAALGVLFSWLVVSNINFLSDLIGWTPFSGDVYYLPPGNKLPVSWDGANVPLITGICFSISLLAGLYPSFRAASLNAVDSIRNE